MTLAAIDPQKYGNDFGRQLAVSVIGAAGGRAFNVGYNAGAQRFVNDTSKRFITNIQGYSKSSALTFSNYAAGLIK